VTYDSGSTNANCGANGPIKVGGPTLRRTTLGLLAAAAAVACPSVAVAADPPPASLFPVGVFLQPVANFDIWKARGVNTVVDFWPGQQPLEEWNAAAVQRGLYMIRAPRDIPSQDINQKYLLAWSHHDEPELNGVSVTQVQASYAVLHATDPKRPVYINFSGWNVLSQSDTLPDSLYQQYVNGADWTGQDIYPITGFGRADWLDYSKTATDRWTAGIAVDKLRQLSGGKPQFAYIETSDQKLGWVPNGRGPTPDELRGEVWDAIIHGAKGIVYFPQQIGGTFIHDATIATVAAEITKQDALINSLGAVLNNVDDVTDHRITLTSGGKVNPLLEATWRELGGKKYLFVLNMSSLTLSNQAFTIAGLGQLAGMDVLNEARSESLANGTISDTFSPWQLHIYTTSSAVGAFVPEPTSVSIMAVAAAGCLLKRKRRRAA
jgi:hypothetical protein